MNRLTKQALSLLRKARSAETLPKMLGLVTQACELMTPRPKSEKIKASRRVYDARAAQEKAAQNMSTAEIRAFVMERANGQCECGCGQPFVEDSWTGASELDHWEGGSGRKKQRQSVKNTWALRRDCHWERTHYHPDSATWNRRFREHCERHGYPVLQHVEHKPLPRRGTA